MKGPVLLILAAAIAAAALLAADRLLPARLNPFAPLDLRADAGPFAWLKLNRFKVDPEACYAALEAAGIAFLRVPDRTSDAGCGLDATARVRQLTLRYDRPFVATCPVLAALVLLERQVLVPSSERRLGAPVVAVEHLGSYACRNVYGRASGRRSQHATANALDVAGFVLEDGRRISLARDWEDGGPVGAFLADAQAGACRFFNAALGPDYNAAHRDHFHLDMGPWPACR